MTTDDRLGACSYCGVSHTGGPSKECIRELQAQLVRVQADRNEANAMRATQRDRMRRLEEIVMAAASMERVGDVMEVRARARAAVDS